jgi:hypothetical protein
MALLTERQQTAAALAREIQRMGAFVVNPMPLPDDQKLRLQVLDANRQQVLEQLSQWNWSPTFYGTLPRICSDGWKLASLYEIDLPRERQPVLDDRQTIYGEIARPEKTDVELEGIRKYLGWPPSQKRRR